MPLGKHAFMRGDPASEFPRCSLCGQGVLAAIHNRMAPGDSVASDESAGVPKPLALTSQAVVPSGLRRLASLHYRDDTSDKVWGGAIQQQSSARSTGYRFVAFWGRRGRALNLRMYEWTTFELAVYQFDKTLASKEGEGYRPVDWREARYGMCEVVRELEGNWHRTEPQPQAELPPAPTPAQASPGPALPPLRSRRRVKLD